MSHLHVHNLFLWSMAVIYLFAFASLYHQLPGLYGDKGVLPVASRELTKTPKFDWNDLVKHWSAKPTLLWITRSLGLDVQTSMDLLALVGIALSSFAIITRFARNMLVFGTLWLLYLSFYSVGNVFLWFQWDALLMEAGFLAFIFAPIPLLMPHRIHAKLAGLCMWPVRWLFFRLMFSSGILKLTSGCPTWWKLTAMYYHYESQCIPTFVAWYIHQMPGWFDQLTILHALFCEVVLPFFFFAPTKGLRKFAWYNQVILQIGIIVTGNYNWFNLLSIVLSLSLLDDEDLGFKTNYGKVQVVSKVKGALVFVFNFLIIGGILTAVGLLYNIRYDEKSVLSFKPGFGEKEVHAVMEYAWPVSVVLGLLSLLWAIGYYFRQQERNESSFTKIYRGIFLGFYIAMAGGLFALSLIPYNTLSKSTDLGYTGVKIRQMNKQLEKFNLVSGYGLFRRMTGVEGRPELILEGSNDLDSGWKPYEFLYKPGKVDRPPPFVIPHQPRLDWQMWFAALGDQNSSPWVHNVAYRLLQAQPEVLRLIDPTSPFYKKPPKYIRGQLYKYWFTSIEDKDQTGNTTGDWWKRKFEREWLSPVSLEDERFVEIVTQQGITKTPKEPKDNFRELHNWVKMVRDTATTLSAPMFIWSVFMINVAFHRTLKALRM